MPGLLSSPCTLVAHQAPACRHGHDQACGRLRLCFFGELQPFPSKACAEGSRHRRPCAAHASVALAWRISNRPWHRTAPPR
eukprot:scaffold29674_cov26-Tisochrysis_lutea.AAC.3